MRAFYAPPKFEFGSCLDCVGGASGAIAAGRGPYAHHYNRVPGADHRSRAAGAQTGLGDGGERWLSLVITVQRM